MQNNVTKACIEEIIRRYVPMGRPNPQKWHPVLCKVCHDHGHKGYRAAFRFEGDTVGYHCFNCGFSTAYDPDRHRSMPKKMLELFAAYSIPDIEWNGIIFQNLGRVRHSSTPHSAVSIEPAEIQTPSDFYRLTDDDDDDVAQYAIEYLTNERGIDWQSYPFFLSSPANKKWFGRLIIPVYKNNKLIYYQGRDLSCMHKQKYISPSMDRGAVIYGYENLYTNPDEPLYITEGWFDAFMLGGVATFGNKLSTAQVSWINQSRRQKVVIPDRFGDGHRLANQAIDLGWDVSTPDIPGCKDVSDAITKYGMLYTLRSIYTNTHSGFEASAHVAVYSRNQQ